VNSTIIQYVEPSEDGVINQGKRGMHSASAAYWNDEKDGMWSYKYDGAEKKGMDVVITVMWIAI
jgi:dynein light chain Tctex-type 1